MIDLKDRKIINELQRDSAQTTSMISKRLNIPITTIHNRIKKLKKQGIIINYTINLDHQQMGRPIHAIISININYSIAGKKIRQLDVAKKVKALDGIYEVQILTGGADIIARVLAKDIQDLNNIVTEKLRNIPGVDQTQTAIVLQEV